MINDNNNIAFIYRQLFVPEEIPGIPMSASHLPLQHVTSAIGAKPDQHGVPAAEQLAVWQNPSVHFNPFLQ